MKRRQTVSKVQFVPIDKITVINPRKRNRKVFEGIVRSISQLGLKRPITVIRRSSADDESFDLVCGQGRMEAFKVLGQTEIPALVIEATTEEALVMSLVENVARRHPRRQARVHQCIRRVEENGARAAGRGRSSHGRDEQVHGELR
jgi:ParB family chromosome partitioning protein